MTQKFDLKKLRLSRGLKQSDIALVLGVPQSSISAMESGRTQVSHNYVKTLVEKLAITNVEEYYHDVDENVNIYNDGTMGDNNGYNNYKNVVHSSMSDGLVLSRLSALERDLSDLKDSLRRKEIRCEELQREVMKLTHQLTAFQVMCAKKGIDYDDILLIDK